MTDQQIDYFIAFLAKEAQLIDQHEFDAVNHLMGEKKELCSAFENYMEKVLEHWDDVTPDRRRYLHNILHIARNSLALNHKSLLQAVELHQQLVKVCSNTQSDDQIKLHYADTRPQTNDMPLV